MDNTLKIGERTYSFGTIPALEAVGVEIAVARVIGEPLFKMFMDEKDQAPENKGTAVAAAIGLLLSKMDAKELVATMETVFKYVSVDSKRVEINSTFTGRNKELWQVFVAALRFNFKDFFPEGFSGSVEDMFKSSSQPSPKT